MKNLSEGYIRKTVRMVLREMVEDDEIISYIKRFGVKGKLPSCTESLESYYEPYLKKAYAWASEKVSDVAYNGFSYFKYLFNAYVVNDFKLNKRGLIYVERNIDIELDGDLSKLNYKSVGECWAWRRGHGRSYCSNINNGIPVKICGYVHPNSINWLETVYLNSYDMKNEVEIRMNDNAIVEVCYIKICGRKFSLGGSMLINASADNELKKNW